MGIFKKNTSIIVLLCSSKDLKTAANQLHNGTTMDFLFEISGWGECVTLINGWLCGKWLHIREHFPGKEGNFYWLKQKNTNIPPLLCYTTKKSPHLCGVQITEFSSKPFFFQVSWYQYWSNSKAHMNFQPSREILNGKEQFLNLIYSYLSLASFERGKLRSPDHLACLCNTRKGKSKIFMDVFTCFAAQYYFWIIVLYLLNVKMCLQKEKHRQGWQYGKCYEMYECIYWEG